jgi:hypothetical protein
MKILKRGTGENNKRKAQALGVGVSKASGLGDRNVTVTTGIGKYVSYHMAWCVLRLCMGMTITEFCGYLFVY